jgi:hypothetical protein
VLHAERPEWDHLGDLDPATALQTRKRFLDEVATSGATVFFAHVPAAPALRVRVAGERWSFEPVD